VGGRESRLGRIGDDEDTGDADADADPGDDAGRGAEADGDGAIAAGAAGPASVSRAISLRRLSGSRGKGSETGSATRGVFGAAGLPFSTAETMSRRVWRCNSSVEKFRAERAL
jgi:hypothetical protein